MFQIKWIWKDRNPSEEGYGQVSYLRMVNMDERIHCCFLMGKARVTSKKFVLSTHLELVAAVLLVKVANFLRKESGLFKHLLTCVYWRSKLNLN